MLQTFKRLTGDTALYGLSSILGRVLNFILVPLHTSYMTKAEYGVNADLYSILAFLMVFLTYGFETGFFRFTEKYKAKSDIVFATATRSILVSTVFFVGGVFLFGDSILKAMRYADHPEFLFLLVGIISADVIAAVPLAKLRSDRRAKRFVRNRLTVIAINILMNLFFFMLLPELAKGTGSTAEWATELMDVDNLVVYVLLSNIIANAAMLLDLSPIIWKIRKGFDWQIWREMFKFSFPLMLAGLAGVANEMIDRQFIKYLLPKDEAEAQLGIYSAIYKLSIALVLFNQAFRYAAEPLFFSEGAKGTDRKLFAQILRAFTIVMCFGLVTVLAFADPLKELFIRDEAFWVGIDVLPILLLANVILGLHTNISIWYKLADRTSFGMVITGIGLVFTIGLNVYLIPKIGIMGAAWATLASYTAMATASYLFGQKYYPIPYPIGTILFYLFISSVLGYLAFEYARPDFLIQLGCIVAFVATVAFKERKLLQLVSERIRKR
ncbi:MAG: oligosaccharide flippase family protein [Flavobacteriia bacterium]|nr:oligosaccharide flippase family protein [Flavobacteriia bacterium]